MRIHYERIVYIYIYIPTAFYSKRPGKHPTSLINKVLKLAHITTCKRTLYIKQNVHNNFYAETNIISFFFEISFYHTGSLIIKTIPLLLTPTSVRRRGMVTWYFAPKSTNPKRDVF